MAVSTQLNFLEIINKKKTNDDLPPKKIKFHHLQMVE